MPDEMNFDLYDVVAFNPKNGYIVVPVTTVAATSPDSAKNKAVAKMCGETVQIDAEENKIPLDQALDLLTIRVRRFLDLTR